MRTKLRSLGLIAAVLSLAFSAIAFPGRTAADESSSVKAEGITNVCTAVPRFAASATPDVSITWDGSLLSWPTGTVNIGNMHVDFTSTGDPGNRKCGFRITNTAFLDAEEDELLPATAIRNGLYPAFPMGVLTSYYNIPLGNPGGGINDPANMYSPWWGLFIDLASIDKDADHDTYVSTLTIQVSVGPAYTP